MEPAAPTGPGGPSAVSAAGSPSAPGAPNGPNTPAGSHAVVGITLGDSDLAGLGPLTLRVGQRLLAEVLAVRTETDRMILSIAGRRLEAQVPAGIRQGEIVRVVVAEVLPDRVVFRLAGAVPEGRMAAGARGAGAGTAAGPATGSGSAEGTAAAGTSFAGVAQSVAQSHVLATGAPPRPAAPPRARSAPLDLGRALAELDLPDTPEGRAVVHALVERRLPLARESIQQLRAAIAGTGELPELSARAAVRLREAGLPLTARSVQLATTGLATGTSSPIGVLLGELLSTLRAALGAPARPAGTTSTNDPDPDHAGSPTPIRLADAAQLRTALSLAVAEPTAAEIERVVTLHTRSPEAALAAEGETGVPQEAAARQNARALLLGLLDSDETNPRAPATAADAPDAPAPLAAAPPGEATTAEPRLPDELAEQAAPDEPLAPRVRQLVSALHDRIELDQLRVASTLRAESSGLNAPVAADAEAAGLLTPGAPAPAPQPPTLPALLASQSLVVAVPLAIGGQLSTLQLVVHRDTEQESGGRPEATPAIRASFTLHLRRLGEVGADLRLHGAEVRCRLRAPSEAAAERLSAGMDDLRDRLLAGGLDVRQLDCVLGAPIDLAAQTLDRVNLRPVAAEA